MASYLMRAEDGAELLIERPMTRAPRFGSSVRRSGKRYTRWPETSATVIPNRATEWVCAPSLPRQKDPRALRNPAPSYSARGVARFRGKKEIAEFCARSQSIPGESHSYGDV